MIRYRAINNGGETMDKMMRILKAQYGIDGAAIEAIHGGLSAMNYKVTTEGRPLFLKVYDKQKAQTHQWTENIERYMPILIWLNENTELLGRIVRPIKTVAGDFCFDDAENVVLLFDFIEGEPVGEALTHLQLSEAAEILACLHGSTSAIPFIGEEMREGFSVPFCGAMEAFIARDFAASPEDVKAILQPCLPRLLAMSGEVKALAEQAKRKNVQMVLCHTDAHGYNLMQGQRLMLVDWEGIKLAPAEADLLMFTKPEYWDVFMAKYRKLRPDFCLDQDILSFYVLRRKIEDIWEFVEGIVQNNLSAEERARDLGHLSRCCETLENGCFSL